MGDMKDSGRAHPNYVEMFDAVTDANKTKEEITAAYDKWSNYEEVSHSGDLTWRDLFKCSGDPLKQPVYDIVGMIYIVLAYAPNRPLIGAKAFEAQYGNNKDIKILDAGAGSGLASMELVKLGYHDIDALEPCETLAKQALEKNIYKKWFKAYMCKDRLPIDDDVYDVIYSVGVFSKGQAREDCLEELIRVLKPGGQIMIITGEGYLKHPYMANFEPRIAELEKEGILIRRKRDLVPNYSSDETGPMNGLVLVLEKPKC